MEILKSIGKSIGELFTGKETESDDNHSSDGDNSSHDGPYIRSQNGGNPTPPGRYNVHIRDNEKDDD